MRGHMYIRIFFDKSKNTEIFMFDLFPLMDLLHISTLWLDFILL
jgi:hypothetical protein